MKGKWEKIKGKWIPRIGSQVQLWEWGTREELPIDGAKRIMNLEIDEEERVAVRLMKRKLEKTIGITWEER